MSAPPKLRYRPDIDGLRALAVLAVVGFHATPRFLPGGFVGVDVFFVISGFLISTIVFSQLSSGTFSFVDFYLRRVRRILPALLVVLVACWICGWFVLVRGEYRELLKHFAGGASFLSNVLLWGEASYFDARSEAKPLLHLWSLAVEEQFYLFWPPIVVLCWRRGLNLLSVIILVIAVSFIVNVILIDHHAVAAFYLPTSRMWELMLGALLAYVQLFRRDEADALVNRIVFAGSARPDDRLVANAKSWAGLTLIVFAALMLQKISRFPAGGSAMGSFATWPR